MTRERNAHGAPSASEPQITTSGAVAGAGRVEFYLGIREEELSTHPVFEGRVWDLLGRGRAVSFIPCGLTQNSSHKLPLVFCNESIAKPPNPAETSVLIINRKMQ